MTASSISVMDGPSPAARDRSSRRRCPNSRAYDAATTLRPGEWFRVFGSAQPRRSRIASTLRCRFQEWGIGDMLKVYVSDGPGGGVVVLALPANPPGATAVTRVNGPHVIHNGPPPAEYSRASRRHCLYARIYDAIERLSPGQWFPVPDEPEPDKVLRAIRAQIRARYPGMARAYLDTDRTIIVQGAS